MSDEDDKATVVIDLNKLRKEKEKQDKDLSNFAESLEFNLEESAPVAAPRPKVKEPTPAPIVPKAMPHPKVMSALPVVMFEFGGNLFAQLKQEFPDNHKFHMVNTVPELNGWLKKKTPFVVCLPLDVNPKSVNQLCVQLKAKFSLVHVVLVGKTLTETKIAAHKNSPAKAGSYLVYPFSSDDLKAVLDKISQQKVA
jgi:hypothetical protein